MEEHPNGFAQVPRLQELAEFRYQLRKFLNFSEIAAERHGIQAQQYQLLQVIAATPPGQVASISYLADRMVLRHNSTVELVDRAERAGLVRRHTDERDLRRSLIKMTPHGEQILLALVSEHLAELDRQGEELVQALHAVSPEPTNGGPAKAPEASSSTPAAKAPEPVAQPGHPLSH